MTLAQANRGGSLAPSSDKEATIENLLRKHGKEIAMALPKHVTPERMLRIALSEVRRNPKLKEATAVSLLSSIFTCAQLGLEPGGPLGQAYLIPYKNSRKGITECQFQIGYKGMIELARRSGQIATISARAVYERDVFEYSFGLDETLRHIPATGNRGELIYAYAVAKLKDGGTQFEVMDRDELEAVREGSQGYQTAKRYKSDNPWISAFDEMCRKTVIRRLWKYLPISIEIMSAVAAEESTDRDGYGQQNEMDRILSASIEAPPLPPSIVDVSASAPTLSSSQLEQLRTAMANVLTPTGVQAFEIDAATSYHVDSVGQVQASAFSELMRNLGNQQYQELWNQGLSVSGERLIEPEESEETQEPFEPAAPVTEQPEPIPAEQPRRVQPIRRQSAAEPENEL